MENFHVRSTSMPSRPRPMALKVEEELQELKVTLTTSSSSAEAEGREVSSCLGGVGGLYDSISKLLQMSTIQQSFVSSSQKQWLEKELDESVRLLDLCGITRDVLTTIKALIQLFQLGLRKRGEMCTLEMVRAYIASNKDAQKIVKRSQRKLHKQADEKCQLLSYADNDDDVSIMAKKVLKEATGITTSLLNSVLSCLSMQRQKPKVGSKWSNFVSKAMKKKASCKVEPEDTGAKWSSRDLFDASSEFISFSELEARLECLYKRLIQNRVTLLNFVSL